MLAWKSIGLSDESIKPRNTLHKNLNIKIAVKFNESCLKHDKASFNHRNAVNLFVCE